MEDHQHLPTDLRWDLFRESPEIVGIDISVPVNLSTGSDHRLLPLIELDTSIGRTPDLFQEASLGPISIEVRQSPVPAHRRDEPARVSRLDERSNSELGELGKKPVIAVPCTSPSSTGQLVFDTNMLAAKSRKLRKKTKAELEASRMLRKSGGACLKHKAARKACRCFAAKASSPRSVIAAKKTPQPVTASSATVHRTPPSSTGACNGDIRRSAEVADEDGNVLQEASKQHNVQQNWAPAADADDLFKHTWVHMCPYVFAPCYFWTLDKKEWEDHLIALHGQRLDSAAQEEPNLVFQGNDTLTTFI